MAALEMEMGNEMMQELKKALKLVLAESVKSGGEALENSVGAVASLCTLLEQALVHGLKLPRSRFAAWRSSKTPPSFFGLLESIEQQLPFDPVQGSEIFWGSLGLQPIRDLNWATSAHGKFRLWIRQSLNTRLLGARLKLIVQHQQVLQQWYQPWALLQRDDTVDEFLSIALALNAVDMNLSMDVDLDLSDPKLSHFAMEEHKVEAVLDVLSPIESSCSSPEQNSPVFQEEFRVSGNRGFDAGSSGDKDKTDMTTLGVLTEGTDLVNFDPENGISDNEDFSEHSSMFGVDMEEDEHVCFDGKNPVDSATNHQWLIQNAVSELAFGGDDWENFVHENGEGLESFSNTVDDLTTEKTLSKNLLHLQEIQLVGADQESIRAGPSKLQRSTGDSFMTEDIWGTGRVELDEDGESGEDNMFKAHLDQNETTQSASLSPISSPDQNSGTPHSLWSGSKRPDPEEHGGDTDAHAFSGTGFTMGKSSLGDQDFSLAGTCKDSVTEESSSVRKDGLLTVSSFSEFNQTHWIESGIKEIEPTTQKLTGSQYDSSSQGCELRDLSMTDGPGIALGAIVSKSIDGNGSQNIAAKSGLEMEVVGSSIMGSFKEKEVVPSTRAVGEVGHKRGSVMRLSSRHAEELLQLDLTKLGRALQFPLKMLGKGGNDAAVGKKELSQRTQPLETDELARSMEKSNVIETYMDIVPDMEDVLFDTHGSGHQVFEVGKPFHLHPHPLERDGSLTASMSGRVQGSDLRPFQLSGSQSVEVLWAEVVGAHQQQGGASFGDRVVGIQDHTVYRILVRGIDGKEWEVERRYREFVALHQQLSRRFSSQAEIALPACWEKVQSESWKLFGHTSPNVVEARSALIHACLQSLLRAGPPLNNAAPLLRFLFPTGYSIPPPGNTRTPANARSSDLEGEVGGSHFPLEDFGANYAEHQDSPRSDILEPVMKPVLGSSIRLILQVHKKRALKQQLRAQQHMCAGCHMHHEIPIGLVSSLVQSFGLGEPRWCEYSGQLYCSTCHLNETAVIPAHVLHFWDFTPHKVSQLAKAYLDSIYNQPMLCVSAVNPYLYSRVPILAHVREMRGRLSKMVTCIGCPALQRIQATATSYSYLLENNDFFALRDLVDLSKGAFAVLPEYMQSLLEKVSVHIKRDLTFCQKSGERCAAVELCNDPDDFIFPFQEDNIIRCVYCHVPFHKRCFVKCKTCPSCCGADNIVVFEEHHRLGELLGVNDTKNVLQDGHLVDPSNVEVDVGTNFPVQEPVPLTLISSSSTNNEASRTIVRVPVGHDNMNAKQALSSSVLTPKETKLVDSQVGHQDSEVLNMNPLLAPLEL